MKNKWLMWLLFLPVLVLGALIGYYRVVTNYDRIEVVVSGYDPKDFLSGYYLDLQLNWNRTDCTQFASGKCPVEEFQNRYKFYIKREQSEKLSTAVNAGLVKLVFSYAPHHTPYVIDLLVDDKSYITYLSSAD